MDASTPRARRLSGCGHTDQQQVGRCCIMGREEVSHTPAPVQLLGRR